MKSFFVSILVAAAAPSLLLQSRPATAPASRSFIIDDEPRMALSEAIQLAANPEVSPVGSKLKNRFEDFGIDRSRFETLPRNIIRYSDCYAFGARGGAKDPFSDHYGSGLQQWGGGAYVDQQNVELTCGLFHALIGDGTFDKLMQVTAPYRTQAIANFTKTLGDCDPLRQMADLLRLPTPNVIIRPSILVFPGHSAHGVGLDAPGTVYAIHVFQNETKINNGRLEYGTPEELAAVLRHEVGHFFVDSTARDASFRQSSIISFLTNCPFWCNSRITPEYTYSSLALSELTLRAMEAHWLKKNISEDAGRLHLKIWTRAGFILAPLIEPLLDEFDNNSEKWPSWREFAPRLYNKLGAALKNEVDWDKIYSTQESNEPPFFSSILLKPKALNLSITYPVDPPSELIEAGENTKRAIAQFRKLNRADRGGEPSELKIYVFTNAKEVPKGAFLGAAPRSGGSWRSITNSASLGRSFITILRIPIDDGKFEYGIGVYCNSKSRYRLANVLGEFASPASLIYETTKPVKLNSGETAQHEVEWTWLSQLNQ